MKKVISIALALVIALSCAVMAFAEATTNVNINGEGYVCPDCNKVFTDAAEYNAHLDEEAAAKAAPVPFFDLSASAIVERLLHIFQTEATWWDAIEDIIIKLIDLVENGITGGTATEADVAGAISDLEAKIASLPIIGDILTTIHNLITSLKQKIKDLYAGNKETVIEETDAAPSADTGSSSLGIAAFAAISVAAAAAYVCTKKKAA
ncbi:MAG: C2H2-type zinc finger protein [Clostridia bacterium]|nr:C2H2-type zinc finger protein [Clostridia bacterium]